MRRLTRRQGENIINAKENGNMMMRRAYYTTKELARLMGVSVKWVEKWRHEIVGAMRFGRIWRFDKYIVDERIAKGQDLRASKKLTAPRCRKYIPPVHGAARSDQKKGESAWH